MEKLFTLINFFVFLALSGIHFYWLLGGRWALDMAVPTDSKGRYLFRPAMPATMAIALGLLGFGVINLAFAGMVELGIDIKWLKYAMIAIALVFLLRAIGDFKYIGMTKRYRNTLFARKDSWFYTPLCLLLAVSHFYLFWQQ